MHFRIFTGVLLILTLFLTLPGRASSEDPRLDVLQAMKEELDRNMKELAVPGGRKLLALFAGPKMYYLGYRFTVHEFVNLDSKYGAIRTREESTRTCAYVQVRLGDYELDNTPINSLGIGGHAYQWTYGPSEINPEAIRTLFWLSTDSVFKEAVEQFTAKQGEMSNRVEEADRPPDFSKEAAVKHIDPPLSLGASAEQWAALTNTASARFKQYPWIHDSTVTVWGKRTTTYMVNSEGSEIIKEEPIFFMAIGCSAWNSEGEQEGHDCRVTTQDIKELPTEANILGLVDQTASELKQLIAAPKQTPYTGPAILYPDATGVFFHEALGHRLEGDRLRTEYEGHTFKDKIGENIIPDFITVQDDPTSVSLHGKCLAGHYSYDEDGVLAKSVTLVENGVLKDFLMGRAPTKGHLQSNGHGRADAFRQPMARMSNLIISSSKGLPSADLKALLIAECKKRNKPYGLIVKRMSGGETNTTDWEYQAFKQSPQLLYQVNLETGEETLVRGAEIVGTPLAAIQNILACGDTVDLANKYCGSISGSVPTATVAPAVLCAEVEFQKANYQKGRPPALKPPFAAEEPKRP